MPGREGLSGGLGRLIETGLVPDFEVETKTGICFPVCLFEK